MKILLFTLLGITFVCGEPGSTREKIAAYSGADKSSAQDLLVAIESNSMDQVRTEMSKLVEAKKPHLVCLALTDPSDQVKIAAARALSSVRKKGIALELLAASKYLEIAVRGGTEADSLRARTKQAFEHSLAEITGIMVEQKSNPEEKQKKIREAIDKLPE